jgi:hypothetical protein
MLPPPPPRRQARNELKPAAAFRIPASKGQLRHLRATAIGYLHPDKTVPRADRDRDRPARSPRPAIPDTITKKLTSRTASSPHGCPGPSTSPTNARATRARSARPATVTLSRTAVPAISAPALPRPHHSPGGNHRAGRTHRDARSTQRLTSSRNTRPARPVAVRGNPAVHTDRPSGRTPSAMCPWIPRHRDLQRYKVTHRGTRRKRPAGPRFRSERAIFPGCGRCWVRTNEGLADGFTARSLRPSHHS